MSMLTYNRTISLPFNFYFTGRRKTHRAERMWTCESPQIMGNEQYAVPPRHLPDAGCAPLEHACRGPILSTALVGGAPALTRCSTGSSPGCQCARVTRRLYSMPRRPTTLRTTAPPPRVPTRLKSATEHEHRQSVGRSVSSVVPQSPELLSDRTRTRAAAASNAYFSESYVPSIACRTRLDSSYSHNALELVASSQKLPISSACSLATQ